MLPRAEAPARRLPYTTADMSERLAKKKAEQDAATNAQLAGSVLGPGITRDAQGNIYANGQKVDWSKSVAPTAVPSFNKGTIRPPDPPKGFMDNVGGLLSTAATMGKSFIPGTKESYMLADTIQKNPLSVPLSVVNSFVNTGKNIADLGQVVGGPDLGEPGINYAQAYKRGEGLTMGVEDLLNVLAVGGIAKAGIAKVKPKGFVEGELVSPGVPRNLTSTPRQIIDVAEGSRLPARVVDSPATPATRLAEAQSQRALPPAATRALPPAPTASTTQLPPEFLALWDQVPVAPEAGVKYSALADETPITPAFTTPVEANQYLAGNGSLEQLEKVAPGYLWEAVENNSTASLPSGRFKQIGSGGGWIGMDRYVDQATGKYFGLKNRPGLKQFEAEWHPGPMAEILSNDIAVALGFPDMNLRLIRNSDDSISLITGLAQDVYGGTILDSFQAGLSGEANNWLPSLASRVLIEDRIRMGVLDDLINNGDRHSGNILFSLNDDGTVRLVPIDHEVTFQGPGGGDPRRFHSVYEFNYSIRSAFYNNPVQLFEDIKTAVAKIQQELKQKAPDLLENFETKLVKTSEQFGIPRSRYIDRPVKQLTDDLTQFLNDTPDQIAQKYLDQIAENW